MRNIGGTGEPTARLLADIERLRVQTRELLSPRAVHRRVTVERTGAEGVLLDGGRQFSGAKLGSLFAGAQEVIVAVCTIGDALEQEVTRLFAQSEYMDAIILDSIGTTAVEEAGMYLRSFICRRYGDEEGFKVGPSLSPGYQYWDLRDQRVLFDLVPAAEIGVTLTESCLMLPRKSESTVVPIGRELRITAEASEAPCRFCDRRDCRSRVS